MKEIAAIVVTYNRKDCLLTCLEAIRKQTLAPDIIYIIDNHSTDGTADALSINKYMDYISPVNLDEDHVITSQIASLNNPQDRIDVKYIYKSENTGGAGGFYTGMKMAYDDGYEWLWMMDDDGIPAEDGLQQICFYSKKYNLYFSNALVISTEDRFSLSFDLLHDKKNRQEYEEMEIVYHYATPFNGTFINRTLPENIGFVKKEMFIWGDEQEYLKRTLKNNYATGTVVKSIHYHPKEKGIVRQVFPFTKRYKILIKPENLSYIYYRNLAYLYSTYYLKEDALRLFLIRLSYYLYRFQFIKAIRFLIASKDGYCNNFNKNIQK